MAQDTQTTPLSPSARDPARRRLIWLASGAAVFGAVMVAARIGIAAVLAAAAPPLPLGADLYALNRPASYTFLDKDGHREGMRGAKVGDRLALADMPSYLPAAFLSMEDRRFYQHGAIDPRGLLRAAWTDITAGHVVQGGSTITQQAVKIVFLTPDRTFARKLTEIAGAYELEDHFSKRQILELYLNRIYLGAGAYGVDGAARIYFGKSARDVTLSEAAMLAALTTSPSTFSPRRDLAAARQRATLVLAKMRETGAITQEQAVYATAHPATIVAPEDDIAHAYFLDAAAQEVKALVPSASGDLTIETTMDPALQDTGRATIRKVLDKDGKKAHASQAALVAMSDDGAVRALVGGRDYATSAFNRAVDAHRQPGSAFKPFVYLAALESGLDPNTIRLDQPVTIGDWSPENFDDSYEGPMTLQDAFAHSINSVAVELGQEVGLESVIATARRLGITSPLAPNPSLPLGTSEVTPLELTAAYCSFATVGYRARPYLVTEIDSPTAGVLYRHVNEQESAVIDKDNALLMNGMMYRVVTSGTGRGAAVPGHEVAGKTGTSDNFRDAWFVGFSPGLVAGVWVGNDDSSPMDKVTGGNLPARIWSGFMRGALKNVRWAPLPRTDVPDEPPPLLAASDVEDVPAVPSATADIGPPDFVSRTFRGVGRFFGRVFEGDDRDRAPPPPRDRRRYAPPPDPGRYGYGPLGPERYSYAP